MNLRFAEKKCLLFVLLLLNNALPAQSTGVVFELSIGKTATVSELIHAPNLGKRLSDPNWVYDRFPDGTPNPGFPGSSGAQLLPVQVGFPSVLVDLSQIFPPFSDQTLTHPTGMDTDDSTLEVLIPGVTIQVDSALPWVRTGFSVTAGQQYYILASGRWSNHNDEAWCGPEGHPAILPSEPKPGHLPMPLSTGCMGLLVGRIGVGGAGFAIGTGGVFTASRNGEVHVMCNDSLEGPEGYTPDGTCTFCQNSGFTNSHLSNNLGSITVTLSLNPIQ